MTPRPELSFVVVVHNMQREAPRTLYTLSPDYQRNVSATDYEVIVVDSGSERPFEPGPQPFAPGTLRQLRIAPSQPTPLEAITAGLAAARAANIAIAIDGARLLSPGCVHGLLEALAWNADAMAYTLGWHLGPKAQSESMLEGYDQSAEDQLLASIDWKADGYSLFAHSALAGSSNAGFFGRVAESNLFAMQRAHFDRLGGFDPRFRTPGGGYVNLDFFSRALADPVIQPVLLLGEGTFHQFHGGVATNSPAHDARHAAFREEYRSLRGHSYIRPSRRPIYFGRLGTQAGAHAHGAEIGCKTAAN